MNKTSNPLTQKMTNYRWTICIMMFLALTINYLDRQVLSLTWDEFIKPEFHWNEIHYGYVTATFSIVYAIGMLFAGRAVDWLGTKAGFLWSIGIWSAGACLHALCGIATEFCTGLEDKTQLIAATGDMAVMIATASMYFFLAARCVLAIGEAGYFPAAVKVTADSIEPVDYVDLSFHVNRKAIIDADYHPLKSPLFTIEENPEYAARKELNDQRMADKRMNENERRREDAEFIAYQRLYRFLLKMPKDIDQMPVCVQWLYDTSRIHWRKEAEGYPLTELEKQRQDMHFICKVALMGYMLSRYRTGTMQKMGVVTEYTVADEGKNSGGTGKSFFRSFFELVRKVCYIPGQTLKKKENMAKNFDKFHYTVDSMCLIDDLRPDMMGSEFYNITDNITVKTLYHDEMTLPREATPKIFITMNKMPFDMTEGSTSRRIFLAMQSDYYHDEDYAGQFKKRTPQTKFGKDIFLEATEEERDEAVYMMLQSCQFYLGLQESLIPPMSQDGQMRILYSAIKDQVFIDWANHFFSNQWHWKRPVSISEMAISYLDHRGDSVTMQSVKSVKNEMIEKMQAYCFNMQYTMNPSIVYRSDKGSKYPRHYAWEQEFMNDTIRREERTRKFTRVCFFYKLGEEPKDSKEILSCPETDEEWEEKKRFEDD